MLFPNIYHVIWDVPLGYLAADAILNYQINISKVSSVLCQVCNLNVRSTIQFNSFFLLFTSVWLLSHLISLSDTHKLDRTPLDELSAHRKDFLTTHDSHKRQTPIFPGGEEIRNHNPSRRATADSHFRTRDHWVQPV